MDATKLQLLIDAINTGMTKASTACGKFTGLETKLKSFSCSVVNSKSAQFDTIGKKKNYYLAKTDIIGDVKGRTYFIWSEEECVTLINNMKMPIFDSSITQKDKREIVLQELDNLVSAMLVAEIANQLKISMLGDIPELFEYRPIDLKMFLNNEIEHYVNDYEQIICLQVKIDFTHHSISPLFACIVPLSYLIS